MRIYKRDLPEKGLEELVNNNHFKGIPWWSNG